MSRLSLSIADIVTDPFKLLVMSSSSSNPLFPRISCWLNHYCDRLSSDALHTCHGDAIGVLRVFREVPVVLHGSQWQAAGRWPRPSYLVILSTLTLHPLLRSARLLHCPDL